jgi:hypothetical protein
VTGNRSHRDPIDTATQKSFCQLQIDADLSVGVNVSLGLIVQQGLRIRMNHGQVQVLSGPRKSLDQIPLGEVGRGRPDSDDESNVHVERLGGSREIASVLSYARMMIHSPLARP